MNACETSCHPLSLTRRIEDFLIANRPLSAHQAALVGTLPVSHHPHAWITSEDLETWLASDSAALVDDRGEAILWRNESPVSGHPMQAASSFIIRHPWDFLRANETWIASLREDSIEGQVHASAVIEGVVHIGAGTRILPGVFIEGNVVIGAGCKIGPNCYIRGNTSIGDACHIGQSVEIKNSLILSRSNVGHLSYVGDSVLGEKVNFGAGTTTSNLRHDGKNHRSQVDGILCDTGRRKFGAIVGDGVHTGINTSIYPGRKLWPGTTTRPGDIVQKDVLPGNQEAI